MTQPTLTLIRDEFLAWTGRFRAAKTVDNYRRYINRFIDQVGDLPVKELKSHHLLTWGETWHEIQAVQRMLSWATLDAELSERNPFKRVKRPPLGKRKRILDQGTLFKILRAARPEFRRFLVAMRETLARPQEIRSLCWEELFWSTKPNGMEAALLSGKALFVMEDYKARDRRLDPDTPRVIPITARLGRMLVRLAKSTEELTGPIFLNSRNKQYTNNAVRLRMRAIRKTLNIKPDHRGESVVSYTLRHTMATMATANGIRDRILADLLGHTSTRTTARYQHLQVEHLQDAMATVHARRRVGPL